MQRVMAIAVALGLALLGVPRAAAQAGPNVA